MVSRDLTRSCITSYSIHTRGCSAHDELADSPMNFPIIIAAEAAMQLGPAHFPRLPLLLGLHPVTH